MLRGSKPLCVVVAVATCDGGRPGHPAWLLVGLLALGAPLGCTRPAAATRSVSGQLDNSLLPAGGAGTNSPAAAFTLKLIYADSRAKSTGQIQRSMRRAVALRHRYPGVVAAFDLVAHEDAGHPTRYFREVWRVRDSLAAATGELLPLRLHDGESTRQHLPNVYDAAWAAAASATASTWRTFRRPRS